MANDFSGYSNCVALWRFENGALTADSIGGNTLTAYNTPAADTVDYKEGSACVDLEFGDNDALYMLDAGADADFPTKNGQPGTLSLCSWTKIESFANDNMAIYSKWGVNSNKRNVRFGLITATPTFACSIGYNSGNSEEVVVSSGTPQLGRWYHLAFTFNNSTRAWQFVVWDDTASSKIVNTSGTATNNMNVDDALHMIGVGRYTTGFDDYWDGKIDELVVFKNILSTSEIDQIRAGTFGSPALTFSGSDNLGGYADSLSGRLTYAVSLEDDLNA